MLEAIPKSWASLAFKVRDSRVPVAELHFSIWRDTGKIEVGGHGFRVRRPNRIGGDFILEGAAGEIARARKPRAFFRRFVIHHGGGKYELRAQSGFSKAFVVLDNDRAVGTVAPRSLWRRQADADLPDDWPLPLRMFILWLVLFQWRRAAGAAVAGA